MLFISGLTRELDQVHVIYFQNDITVSKQIWASENGAWFSNQNVKMTTINVYPVYN